MLKIDEGKTCKKHGILLIAAAVQFPGQAENQHWEVNNCKLLIHINFLNKAIFSVDLNMEKNVEVNWCHLNEN